MKQCVCAIKMPDSREVITAWQRAPQLADGPTQQSRHGMYSLTLNLDNARCAAVRWCSLTLGEKLVAPVPCQLECVTVAQRLTVVHLRATCRLGGSVSKCKQQLNAESARVEARKRTVN